ncbi:cytochrome c oxidase accessory protein CcoG [Planctomycetales bacterium ZRK34]|nr:cytochrome c oxidase accessory protein CcoG [Planctomycetales bacterium ZRK34]
MSSPLLQPEQRVLSTLENDGSRRWLKPRVSKGRFLTARRIVAYALIVLFTALPYIPINGKPAILLDIVHRQFTLFGFTFLPTDTILLALFMVGLIISIFLMTALLGRVWCGWACPQTVYLEFVYRPIERLLEGTIGRGGASKRDMAGWRSVVRFVVYLIISMFLAHTFLAYFVGVEALFKWVQSSPFEHPIAFVVMAATTFLMMFDFTYFREQMCIIACPYGRFQSVMLDRNSLIIGYDEQRGEPRGRFERGVPDSERKHGDCIDCLNCVTTCPTGIDIREGLQMECVACAQCVDACDSVMDKIGRPRGLIRYSSQAAMSAKPDEKPRLLRPRVIFYPALLLIIATIFTVVFSSKGTADVMITRNYGSPFARMGDDRISNSLRLKIVNRTADPAAYRIAVISDEAATVETTQNPIQIEAGATLTEGMLLTVPQDRFRDGHYDVKIRVTGDDDFEKTVNIRLIGPAGKNHS